MRVLVVGGGGREHALVWALRRSGAEVVCAPGNAGIAQLARCVPIPVTNTAALVELAGAEQATLVVVGPEVPLSLGLTDALQAAGCRVFGPTQAAAQLESSKAFSKDFMQRWQLPTARFRVCSFQEEVRAVLPEFAAGVVVKADGLAAGKGVVLCETRDAALEAAQLLFAGGVLGPPAQSVVVEEMLSGPELSYFALSDGTRAVTLAAAQDHKRLGEGDTGPNTGGMGAYSTDSMLPPALERDLQLLAQRVVDGMAAEGTPFVGLLFMGLMLTADGPRILEFNTRFGDPETEAILLRLCTPLAPLLMAAAEGDLRRVPVELSPDPAACVVAASAGYPLAYETGYPIEGLPRKPSGVEVFHAGTASSPGGEVLTAGGRVLVAAAAAPSLTEALCKCYGALERIHFEGMYYRRDIGGQAL